MWQRSTLIGSPIFTRASREKLGLINQIWCISGFQQVVVLGVCKKWHLGAQRYVKLENVEFSDSALWVEKEDVVGRFSVYTHTTYLRAEIMTEVGLRLGRVRDFRFDKATGNIRAWELSSTGFPFIPEPLARTHELLADELVSSSYKRLIVAEGAENRLNQVTFDVREGLC